MKTIEDALRFATETSHQVSLCRTTDGRWQANVRRGNSNAFSVQIHDDPIDALWNAITPYQMHRHPKPANPPAAADDLEDLLG